ncbi:uncharacterized protein LOC132732504 [Ruditapes philippinarum]|uniref:uncharacterized protein LOC132732504 n=1 Tax=Ruditapes philippinarum TaxID=129788 RepID=UPI00295BFB2D|nr:uncharacterized protein LOC132732504 [Ruditapes philippinarum]XP_060574924.1 uncharacterized protein LOC132732504 [Ruditapes philippinarum]XP_060574925.1 uncharacterized protein LOC132732504 [Ruditapes philippinarum]XP_060574927.1 uncharacterized protein LOC132732504 [Ruditapes philippinarum]XP_060574928.1 uncharacterized protein LOC132732504 [Ruditapes philippinarum]
MVEPGATESIEISDDIDQPKDCKEETGMLLGRTSDSYDKCDEFDDFVDGDVSTKVGMDTDHTDCEITGIIVKTDEGTEQSISADVIAQIDFEIAKSLKEAFSKIGDFGLNNKSKVGSNSFFLDNKLPQHRNEKLWQRTSDEVKGSDLTLSQMTNIRKKTTSDLKELNGCFQDDQISSSVKDSFLQRSTKCGNDALESISSEDGHAVDNHSVDVDLPDIVKEDCSTDRGDKLEDDVVWICFICAKEFADQSKLMLHQEICETDRKSLTKEDLLKPSLPPQGSHLTIPSTLSETKCNCPPPVPTLLRKVGSSLKSLPLGIPTKRKERQSRKLADIYIPPSRNVYFESLGLYPTPSVEAIWKSPRKSVSDDDCQIIDLTMEDAPQAVPLTPRTRSMLSQLSRDDSNTRKRQLSFSESTHLSRVKEEPSVEKELSEDSECSIEESIQRHKVPSKSAILGIPLTSPLGQRLKKHWKYENKVPIVSDIEKFCKTDDENIFHLNKVERKNRMVEKLRNRPPAQCTFRFTKKYINKWFHLYKFNKDDRREFAKRLKFGLDRDSRLKLKKMKPCKVVVARVSKKDVKYWTTPRLKALPKRAFPQFSMANDFNRQFRFNQVQYAASNNIIRPVQAPMYNQFIQPVSVVRPTPQLLVRTVPMGGQGMRLQVLPIQQTQQTQPLFPPARSGLVPVASQATSRSQKRKQVFNNVREDDGMVICLSSDDEDDIVIKPVLKPQCILPSIDTEEIRDHSKRKIGPASFMRRQSRDSTSASITDKPSAHFNFIHSMPVNTGQLIQYPNTASARVFGLTNAHNATVPQKPVSNCNMSQLNVNDNKVSVVTHTSQNEHPLKESSQTVQLNTDINLAHNESVQGVTDYMDYEVICIDSDEDGD